MIDVTHDRHDRRARLEVGLVVDELLGLLLLGGVLDDDLAVDLGGDQLTASSESDCVICTISPSPIMILMICAAGIPSACERSRTVTPDGTVTGPVGATTGCAGPLVSRRSLRPLALVAAAGAAAALVDDDATLAARGRRRGA